MGLVSIIGSVFTLYRFENTNKAKANQEKKEKEKGKTFRNSGKTRKSSYETPLPKGEKLRKGKNPPLEACNSLLQKYGPKGESITLPDVE